MKSEANQRGRFFSSFFFLSGSDGEAARSAERRGSRKKGKRKGKKSCVRPSPPRNPTERFALLQGLLLRWLRTYRETEGEAGGQRKQAGGKAGGQESRRASRAAAAAAGGRKSGVGLRESDGKTGYRERG